MTTAPERTFVTWPNKHSAGRAFNRSSSNRTEYVRADLAAVQPAHVRVRDGDIERAIWSAMAWAVRHAKQLPGDIMPAYTDSGNSDAETACRIASARILAALEPQPDQTVEIDLRAAMMEELEKAASESPWVPEEYYMNEVISDCCAFLRSDRSQPDPRDEVIARLVEAATEALSELEVGGKTMQTVRNLRAALAAAKEVQHG